MKRGGCNLLGTRNGLLGLRDVRMELHFFGINPFGMLAEFFIGWKRNSLNFIWKYYRNILLHQIARYAAVSTLRFMIYMKLFYGVRSLPQVVIFGYSTMRPFHKLQGYRYKAVPPPPPTFRTKNAPYPAINLNELENE